MQYWPELDRLKSDLLSKKAKTINSVDKVLIKAVSDKDFLNNYAQKSYCRTLDLTGGIFATYIVKKITTFKDLSSLHVNTKVRATTIFLVTLLRKIIETDKNDIPVSIIRFIGAVDRNEVAKQVEAKLTRKCRLFTDLVREEADKYCNVVKPYSAVGEDAISQQDEQSVVEDAKGKQDELFPNSLDHPIEKNESTIFPAQLENETCHDPRVEQDETCLQEPVPFVENQETNGCGMIETIDSDGIKEVLKSLIHTIFFRTEVRNEISIFRKEVATDLSNLRMDVTNISNNIDTLYELAILPYMTEDKAYEVKSPYKLDCCLITKDPIEEQEWTNKLLELKSQKLLEHYEKLQYETDFVEINFLKIKKEDRKCVQIFEATISNLKHGGMLLTKLVQLERQVMMFSKIHPSHTIECIGLVSTGENPKIKETLQKHQNILSITWKMFNEGKFKYLQRGHSVGIC